MLLHREKNYVQYPSDFYTVSSRGGEEEQKAAAAVSH